MIIFIRPVGGWPYLHIATDEATMMVALQTSDPAKLSADLHAAADWVLNPPTIPPESLNSSWDAA